MVAGFESAGNGSHVSGFAGRIADSARENSRPCGILLEVVTSIKASRQAKKAIQELAEFYPFGKFKLAGNEVLMLGKELLGSVVHDCR
jgi:hypothetical protein